MIKHFKKCKNKEFRDSFNDRMLGVQYSFYKMEVTFTLCKGLHSLTKRETPPRWCKR